MQFSRGRGNRLCCILPCVAAQESTGVYLGCEGLSTWYVRTVVLAILHPQGQALRYARVHDRRGSEPDSLHCGDERSLRLGGTVLRSVADDAMWRDSGRFQESLGDISGPNGLQADSDPTGATRTFGKFHSCLMIAHCSLLALKGLLRLCGSIGVYSLDVSAPPAYLPESL